MGCIMIPAFGLFGLLPPGVHDATWAEVVASLGFTAKRNGLLAGLKDACLNLRQAGAASVFIDGSFSTGKKQPGDWDCCYSAVGVDATKLDPVLKDYSNGRLAQKKKYGGEMFIASSRSGGIIGPPYLDFFQKDKGTGWAKGIIRLDLGTI